ncbi:hypothetical protein ACN38_g1254 [Penicillium nordicum]|uniref:Uncharacterized protein n=1 Tax=Penicillium nordicum TaxID=229535 RepID=A0A0M9WJZ8_9EURO|nr:hypothetical protein ACN38_g1254 [Penicillium nordicum]
MPVYFKASEVLDKPKKCLSAVAPASGTSLGNPATQPSAARPRPRDLLIQFRFNSDSIQIQFRFNSDLIYFKSPYAHIRRHQFY